MKKHYIFFLLGILLTTASYAQSSFPPVSIEQGTFLFETEPLRDYPTVELIDDFTNLPIIPNNLSTGPQRNPNALPVNGDPLANNNRAPFRSPEDILQNFNGIDISEGQAIPPDPTGAAGPDHYVHAANLVVKIFDKTGAVLAGPTSLGTFLGSGNNSGDPIVMYDQLADRFFVSQFRTSDNALIIGVSTTPDPTGTYNVYSYPLDSFPDYPHYSVWHNAYIVTANKSGQTSYAFDRQAMIDGDADPTIIGFPLPGVVRRSNWVFGPSPANLLGTDFTANAPGYVVYLQDDGWSGAINFDHLKIWELTIDFVTPGNSSVSAPFEIATTPFDSVFFSFGAGDVNQPGTSTRLDNLGSLISYMVNYRTFPTYNSMLVNFNVDLGSQRSGIRWFELRNTGTGPFTIHQEGTWDLDDGESRFMGSMAMDVDGNIGLAYNIGSSNTRAGIRFTGRLANDPLGQMSFQEQIIQDGVGFQSSTNRFGDYTHMTLDPDGETFWFTAEYFRSNNAWRTKIASFNLDGLPILGTNDFSLAEGDLKIYPLNEGVYEVLLNSTADLGKVNFELIDIQGKSIMTNTLTSSGEIYRSTFSTSNLAAGVYIVKVFNNNTFEETKRIIIK